MGSNPISSAINRKLKGNLNMPVCERCNKEHDGKMGSGRFCSKTCSNTQVHSQATKDKITNSVNNFFKSDKQIKVSERIMFDLNCSVCNTKFQRLQSKNYLYFKPTILCEKCHGNKISDGLHKFNKTKNVSYNSKYKKVDGKIIFEKILFDLICTRCNIQFQKVYNEGYLDKRIEVLCNKCKSEKLSESVLNSYKKRDIPYHLRGWNFRRQIVWNEQGQKCNKCGFNELTLETGPYEFHHIDGNRNNKNRSNEEILCTICHHKTDNHRFKNKKHGEPTKKQLYGGVYNYNRYNKKIKIDDELSWF